MSELHAVERSPYMIRRAGMNECDTFERLWSAYVTEMFERFNGEISPEAIEMYVTAFHTIACDSKAGIVLFAQHRDEGEIGALMWGMPLGLPVHFSGLGRVAMGYGTYVAPAHRRAHLARDMRRFAARELALAGYESIIGTVNAGNEAGREAVLKQGFQPFQTTYSLDLRRAV